MFDKGEEETNPGPCGWPDCCQNGEFKAPVSMGQLQVYHWFCLEHIRIYNSSWNFYEGMSDLEVEAAIRSDVTWNRPTWPMGSVVKQDKKLGINAQKFENFSDMFEIFNHNNSSLPRTEFSFSPAVGRAINLLSLEVPFSKDEVKARYKILVKRHHPDANGGDKNAEERLKQINEAYETVMDMLAC